MTDSLQQVILSNQVLRDSLHVLNQQVNNLAVRFDSLPAHIDLITYVATVVLALIAIIFGIGAWRALRLPEDVRRKFKEWEDKFAIIESRTMLSLSVIYKQQADDYFRNSNMIEYVGKAAIELYYSQQGKSDSFENSLDELHTRIVEKQWYMNITPNALETLLLAREMMKLVRHTVVGKHEQRVDDIIDSIKAAQQWIKGKIAREQNHTA